MSFEENIKYVNGAKIYKLVSAHTDKVYIGSTIHTLPARFARHRYLYKQHIKGNLKNSKMSAFEILKYADCKPILIEFFPCRNRFELSIREQEIINNLGNICVNLRKEGKTTGNKLRDKQSDKCESEFNQYDLKNDIDRLNDKIGKLEDLEKDILINIDKISSLFSLLGLHHVDSDI